MPLIDGLFIGLAQGLRHSAEPDHVAAVTTLVSESPSAFAAARTGAAWGMGHAAAVIALGGVLVALRVRVPAELAVALEIAVAITFVALGAVVLRSRDDRATSRPRLRGRSTIVGFIHGLAGSGAITLLCVTTFAETAAAMAFLASFGLGAMISMSVLSGVVAAPLSAVARRSPAMTRGIRLCAALLSFVAAGAVCVAIVRR